MCLTIVYLVFVCLIFMCLILFYLCVSYFCVSYFVLFMCLIFVCLISFYLCVPYFCVPYFVLFLCVLFLCVLFWVSYFMRLIFRDSFWSVGYNFLSLAQLPVNHLPQPHVRCLGLFQFLFFFFHSSIFITWRFSYFLGNRKFSKRKPCAIVTPS